jgi:hypothetical protein
VIPVENIYIITGLSSRDWKDQTKSRFPLRIQQRVFHRSDLPKGFKEDLLNKKDCLIIIDECHIACKRKQTISNMFKNFGLLDLSFLLENDFKILEFSATPNGTLYDLDMWNNHSAKILSEPGSGYVGVLDLMQQKRLKQFKSLYYDESDKKT